MNTRATTGTRLFLLPVLIALLMNLVIGPLAPIIQQLDADVLAAPVTVPDEDGPNDEPGQKDLTQLTIDYDSAPGVVLVTWNWDETGTSGANTLDACALFDINENLFVDFALCAITVGDPAQSSPGSPRAYTCGDDRVDRCTNQVLVPNSEFDSTCTIGVGVNPFDGGADATASCTILLSDIPGGAEPILVNVCTYPSQIPHSDPSDCVLIPRTAFLTVIKEVINNNGGDAEVADFPLFIDDMSVTSGDRTPVTAAIHTVSETEQPGYVMTGISGDCAEDGTVTVEAGDDLTCTITNDDEGATLTVTKIVENDNGGDAEVADFPLFIDDVSVTSGVQTSVTPGSHTVSETSLDGYTGTIGGDCAADGSVTIALGEDKACTITNTDDAPSLTLVKVVDNDNGGEAVATDWTLTAAGPTGFSGDGTASSDATFEAGSYDLSEDGPAGYDPSDWVCVGGTQVDADTVSVELGEDATCTITNNDDAPSLTLVKVVDNANVGEAVATDWTLTADGPTGFSGDGTASSDATFEAGSYDLSEDGPAGYTASAWVCVGGTQIDADTVSVDLGEDATCTITNTRDTGELEIIKDLNPAGDLGVFNLMLDGSVEATDASDGEGTGPIILGTGTYSVGEEAGTGTSLLSYDSSISCIDLNTEGDVEVASGEGTELMVEVTKDSDIVCTITNTAIDVGVGKEHDEEDGKVEAGDIVEFTVTVSVNVGSATNVVVTDTLPDGLTYVDGSASIEPDSIDGQKLTWNLGSLDAGLLEITYEASVDEDAAGLLTNLACVDADQNPAEICTDTTLTVPSLVVDKAASTETITISGPNDALVATPSVVTWTLSYTVTNGPVTMVVISDEIPVGFEFLDASPGGALVDGMVTWTFAELTESGSVTFRTTVDPETISRTGPTLNVATIDSDDTPPDEGEDSVTVVVEPPPLGGTPTPAPSVPNTAMAFGMNGEPTTVPVELLVALFLGSLGAMALANARARSRRR